MFPRQPRPTPLPLAGEGEVHQEQVECDDDGRDEETRRAQGTIVRVIAHDLGRGGQAHERDDREGDTEGQGNLRDDECPRGFCARAQDDERGD